MSSNGSALKGSATPDLAKQVLVQKLAQQIVNQIVSDDVIDDKIEEEENQNKDPTCCQMFCAPFTLKYYQPFFNDLTSKVIAQKLWASFFPFKATFFEIQDGKPDLYGPVWIYATLVFAVAAAGNISGYLATPSNIAFHYNFDFIPTASSLLFGIALLVPFAIYMVMKMLGGRHLHLTSFICIYAYAQTCIIPVCIVCSIPNPQLQWGALIYGMINSSLFLIVNFWGELEKNIQTKKHIVIWLIAGCQVVLLLLFKMYFFLYVYTNPYTGSRFDQLTKIVHTDHLFLHHHQQH
ncbi:unnamed protein product (macronuclear) [Paramecium tetraurelia]|uniref:Protein YIPF n=1 Tax=Paramecium tetraurelia TaxID=5888 RepID=A0E2J8_PARTE|nr:uncharacterized protein GSPATT00022687001 [Paramecium tetraurelia]CAK89515.1 unnamed protein product [Paramecium tetraurelia]|eukprot:XP_001456912.1 hypothetical protein (macronuclear) [Paramecium tetraurelia strain d4-2]